MIDAISKIIDDPTSMVLSNEEMTQAHIEILKHMLVCSNKYAQKDISPEARGIYLNEVRVAALCLAMVIFHSAGRESEEMLRATQLCNKLLTSGISLWAEESQKLRELEKMNTDKTTLRA